MIDAAVLTPRASEAPLQAQESDGASDTQVGIRLVDLSLYPTHTTLDLFRVEVSNLSPSETYQVIVSRDRATLGLGACGTASQTRTVTGAASHTLEFLLDLCAVGSGTVTAELRRTGADTSLATVSQPVTVVAAPGPESAATPLPSSKSGAATARSAARVTSPGAITTLNIDKRWSHSFKVTWSPPSNGGVALSGYGVLIWHADHAQPGYDQAATIGVTTEHTFTGLAPSNTYKFRIHACNKANLCGWWTDPTSVTTAGPPDPPHTIMFRDTTSTSARVRWSAANTGGGDLTTFHLRYWPYDAANPDSETGAQTHAADDGNDRGETVRGLESDTEYEVKLRACNDPNNCTIGAWSADHRFTTEPDPTTTPPTTTPPTVGLPAPPHTISFDQTTFSSTRVNWSADANTGGVPLTGFQILWWKSTVTRPADSAATPIDGENVRRYTVNDLDAATEYVINLRACNGPDSCSTWSADHRVTTLAGTTQPPPSQQPSPRPQNLNIVPEAQDLGRWAVLSWSHVDGAQGYVVQVRPLGSASNAWEEVNTTIKQIGTGAESRRGIRIHLSNLMSRGLLDHPAYELQVQAIAGKDDANNNILSEPSDPVILIDTPISTANGDSRDREQQGDGKAYLRWTSLEEILGDAYRGGEYTFLYRVVVANSNLHHSRYDWRPNAFIGSQTTNPVSGTASTITGLLREHIYAIQLRYQVTVGGRTIKVFAGRDVFVWPSVRPAGNGERVATFPLNHPIGNKTYAYHICTDTFPAAGEFSGDPDEPEGPDSTRARASKFIQHALEQWESSTKLGPQRGLITMTYLGSDCANYLRFIDRILFELVSISDLSVDMIRSHVNGLIDNFDLTEFTEQDRDRNEIIYVDVSDDDESNLVFAEVSERIGLARCGVSGGPVACFVPGSAGNSTGDILLPERVYKTTHYFNWELPRVVFNECDGAGPFVPNRYATIVHEAGHALGIRSGTTSEDQVIRALGIYHSDAQKIHHSQVFDSTVNEDSNPCSPTPLDVMAIYALYQSRN